MKNDDLDEYNKFLSDASCRVLRHLSYKDRCEFVETECAHVGELINYVYYVYCGLRPGSAFVEILCIFHIMTWCAVLFMVTTLTADQFFCPPLKVLSTLLHMSEHLAGVTLLAFGNGSPDLFTMLVAVHEPHHLYYNDVSGGALFVVGLVAGVVCVVSPFQVIASSFLKDVCFLLVGVLFIDFSIKDDGIISRWESIAIFSLYFIYIIIIAVDQVLVTREIKRMKRSTIKGTKYTMEQIKGIDALKSQAEMELVTVKNNERKTFNRNATRQSTRKTLSEEPMILRLVKDVGRALNPIDKEDWDQSKIYVRICMCIRSPLIVVLRIFIPICDYTLNGHGWCKLLNCIQIVLLPVSISLYICKFQVTGPHYTLFGIPYFAVTLALTLPMAIILFIFSKINTPPKCHWILALYSCAGSIFVIYITSSEVVEILNVIGITTGCGEAFLGCTILAFGNNLGDLVSNISLAKQGYQRMAFSACFGGPIFNTHISFGLVLLVKTFNSPDGAVHLNLGSLRDNLSVFLIILLLGALFILISTDFYARRTVGYFFIFIWCLFFLYAVLAEAEFIQTWRKEKSTK